MTKERILNMHDDLSRMIDELLEDVPEWIPVEERLPEGSETVLVTNGVGIYFGYKRRDGVFLLADDWLNICKKTIRQGNDRAGVTHWMPLPKPPEKECVEKPPAVDSPGIVRCKDCGRRNTTGCPLVFQCDTPDNWFCADGEPKEN